MTDNACVQIFIEYARVDGVPELLKTLKLFKARKQRTLIAAAVADPEVPEETRLALSRVVALDPEPSVGTWLQDSTGYWQRMDTEVCEFN